MELLADIKSDRSNLIRALQIIQSKKGYISEDSVKEVADYFSLPPVEVEGVISFYTQFKSVEPGQFKISVCDGTACHIKGSPLVLNWISDELGIAAGETDEDGLFSLETVACLGCCSLAPVISINGKVYGNLDRDQLLKILDQYQKKGDNV